MIREQVAGPSHADFGYGWLSSQGVSHVLLRFGIVGRTASILPANPNCQVWRALAGTYFYTYILYCIALYYATTGRAYGVLCSKILIPGSKQFSNWVKYWTTVVTDRPASATGNLWCPMCQTTVTSKVDWPVTCRPQPSCWTQWVKQGTFLWASSHPISGYAF